MNGINLFRVSLTVFNKFDSDRFDVLQLHILDEMTISIRDGLREAGVKDDNVLCEATGNIAFSVAAIIDGNRIMEALMANL